MQASGQFGVPPSEAPPQYNPVNNTMNNTSSNNSSRATSTPGSNQTLGHILFNLSNHDQQHVIPLSQTSTFTTNPSPAHVHPSSAPGVLLSKAGLCEAAGTELVQDIASQRHHENHQLSHFLHAPASSTLEHFPRSDHCTSTMEWSSAEVHQPQQQILRRNSASGVLPANTNDAKMLAPATSTTKQPATSLAHDTPATVLPGSAPSHTPVPASVDNGEGKQKAEAMNLHHHNQLISLGLDEAVNVPASDMNSRERQMVHVDPMSLGDLDHADEGACAGNRWPRQETIALLKIRADMDAAFRDTSVKRPLWDEVSRKLGELGYERSAKKCKEKFENVNKYYKRTKEGKVGRQDGKNYRFFTQLEALHAAHSSSSSSHTTTTIPSSSSTPLPSAIIGSSNMLVTHTTTDPITHLQASASGSSLLQSSALAGNPSSDTPTATTATQTQAFPSSAIPQLPFQLPGLNPAYCSPHLHGNMGTALRSSSQSSSSSDDDEDDDLDDNDDDDDDATNEDDDDDDEEHRSSLKPHPDPPHDTSHAHDPSHALPRAPHQSKKRKRKSPTSMMAFFEGLLKRVIDKQDQMQQKFLQAMEKRESDRMIREEAWRRQEMARLSKEHELRAQERSSAAARDAALITFLQKVTGQTLDLPTAVSMSLCAPIAAQPVQSAPPLLHQENAVHQYEEHDASDPSSKRWLKPEVLHLIELHGSLQAKFTEAGPKGPLWEEIANGMAKRGYPSRTAKRCKEKWENINKYFKRAKESSKKRPENAKTCPYFHELDALYRKGSGNSNYGKQLPYKPSNEQVHDENVVHQPSMSHHGEGDLDGRNSLQMQPTNIVPTDRATADLDASNANGPVDANRNHSNISNAMTNVSSSNGTLQSNIGSMQLSMDAFHSLNASGTSEHTGPRSGFSAELGLSIQQLSSTSEHKPVNQVESANLEVGAGDHMPNSLAQTESKPSLAPLPNSTSFMANMLQKLTSNTTSASNEPEGR